MSMVLESLEEVRSAEEDKKLQECWEQIGKLAQDMATRQYKRVLTLSQIAADKNPPPFALGDIKERRHLKGHFGKIYAMQWSQDNRHILSAGQDGRLMYWDAQLAAKLSMMKLKSSWVLCCAISPSNKFVCSGGLDNILTVFTNFEDEKEPAKPILELEDHSGYLSCIRFTEGDTEVVTSSGDQKIIIWDLEKGKAKLKPLHGHLEDVSCVQPISPNVLISSSVDRTCKLWDLRVSQSAQMTFYGHTSDVHWLAINPDGNTFASCSDDADDGSIRLWDLRSFSQLGQYDYFDGKGCASIDFTASGRGILAGYANNAVAIWDSLTAQRVWMVDNTHVERVNAVGVSGDGSAFASASWDNQIKVYA